MQTNQPSLNQIAQHLRQYGRGEDTHLVHMTPHELGGLQALAMAHGGSLSINPETGLPEAGFLGRILPMVLGGLLTATGIGAPLAAGIVAAGDTAITGDLKKGLMAGLGAFGGASLAGALGGAGALAGGAADAAGSAAPGVAGSALPAAADVAAQAPLSIAEMGANASIPMAAMPAMSVAAPSAISIANAAAQAPLSIAEMGANAPISMAAMPNMAGTGLSSTPTGLLDKFQAAARIPGVSNTITTGAAGLGLMTPFMQTGQGYKTPKEAPSNYKGPYKPTPRVAQFGRDPFSTDSSERQYFDTVNPYPGFVDVAGGNVTKPWGFADGGAVGGSRALNRPVPGAALQGGPEHNWNFKPVDRSGLNVTPRFGDLSGDLATAARNFVGPNKGGIGSGQANSMPISGVRYDPKTQSIMNSGDNPPTMAGGGLASIYQQRFAGGGPVALRNGAFVVDARTVSELGNGSSSAGQDILSRHGGMPVRGHGDGVSDSIPAQIGGKQQARVARDEVVMPPEAVSRMGGGNPNQGAKKLYGLMNKAKAARRKAGRGSDTRLRGVLGT